MRRLTTFAELARLADITRQAVSDAARSGPLREAVQGRRIDATHPAVREYLSRHDVSERAIDDFVRDVDERRGPGTEVDADDFESYADLTFRQVFERFGTLERFASHLDSYKVYEQVIGQRLKNEELSGKLIDRSFVQQFVFGPLEELSQRLLRDHPKNTARQIYELFTAGGSAEEAEKLIRVDVSSHLVPARRKVETALRAKAAEAAARARGEEREAEPAEPAEPKKTKGSAKKKGSGRAKKAPAKKAPKTPRKRRA